MGQIGVGYPLARCSPEQVGSVGGWTSVTAGNGWGAGVRDDGTLWGWGLAPGLSEGGARAPVQIGTTRDWATVFGGRHYVMAIKNNGSLWGWGANDSGALGLGDVETRFAPSRLGSDLDWVAVACGSAVVEGGDHTLALKSDGTLWAWGSNSKGELGVGDKVERHAPVRVGTAADWKSIAAAGHVSFAINQAGELHAWGKNASGELGLGTTSLEPDVPMRVGTDSDWKQVAAADDAGIIDSLQQATNFVVAVKTDGTLWSWGDGDSLALGLPNGQVLDHPSPTRVGSDSDWAGVACGDEIGEGHALALKIDGSLWSWGRSWGGALGTGDYRWRLEPTQVGAANDWAEIAASANSHALKQDGTLWCWGHNAAGQLGVGDPLWHPEPVDLILTGEDDGIDPTVDATTETGAFAVSVNARVMAVKTSAESGPIRVGAAAPGWYRSPVTVRFSAEDAGWGVARTQYTLNGGISWLTAGSITFRTSGKRTLTYNAVDRARNAAAPRTIVVNIDLVRPCPRRSTRPLCDVAPTRRSSTASLTSGRRPAPSRSS